MNKTLHITLPTMNNGDQLILTFVDGKPCFKNMNGEAVNVNIFNNIEVNIEKAVKEQGYVFDPHENKRWIMAQTFKAMEYRMDAPAGSLKGFDGFYKKEKPYSYQWKTVCDILDHKAELAEEKRFKELEVEDRFFSNNLVIELMREFYGTVLSKIKERILTGGPVPYRFVRHCTPYGRYNTREYLFNQKGTDAVNMIDCIPCVIASISSVTDRREFAKLVRTFFEESIPCIVYIEEDTEKSKLWLDTFKGRGAYFTLKNMITGGHKCKLVDPITGELMDEDESMAYLNAYSKRCGVREGYKLFGMLRKCIKDNNFDFKARMKAK